MAWKTSIAEILYMTAASLLNYKSFIDKQKHA